MTLADDRRLPRRFRPVPGPAPLRDLLLELAVSDLFRAKWSASVHEEWIRALLRSRPDLTAERLERTRRLMDAHVRDALVTGFEDLIGEIVLPDPDDRHVLARSAPPPRGACRDAARGKPADCAGERGPDAVHGGTAPATDRTG